MSDIYSGFAVTIRSLTDDEATWWDGIETAVDNSPEQWEDAPDDEEVKKDQDAYLEESGEYAGIVLELFFDRNSERVPGRCQVSQHGPEVHLFELEDGRSEIAAKLVQLFLKRFRPNDAVVIRWSCWADDAIHDAFYGGGFVVTANWIYEEEDELSEMAAKYKQERAFGASPTAEETLQAVRNAMVLEDALTPNQHEGIHDRNDHSEDGQGDHEDAP